LNKTLQDTKENLQANDYNQLPKNPPTFLANTNLKKDQKITRKFITSL